MENGKSRKSGYWIIGILALVMFGLILLAGVMLVTVVNTGDKRSAGTNPGSNYVISDETLQKLGAIREELDELYLFEMDEADFDTAVIRAYVDALGDPYTVYYTPEEFNDLMEANSGVYYGIGVSVQQDPEDNKITVIRVFRNSPAKEAGVRAGDVVYAVEGTPVGNDSVNLVVSKIRGESGTSVKMTFYRPSENKYIDMDIVRRAVEVDSADGRMLEDGIGYIEILSFDEVTYSQFTEIYESLLEQGMKGVIFDLRGNGGGLLSTVVKMLDYLLPEGILTYTIDKNGNREEYKSDAYTNLSIPAVVLTDEYTASASEIFTAALHDYGVCTTVGTTTFGKGIVQVIMQLTDGSGLKVTISRYYTPNGVCIHGIGIEPDEEVEWPAEEENDVQLEKAEEVLKKQLK